MSRHSTNGVPDIEELDIQQIFDERSRSLRKSNEKELEPQIKELDAADSLDDESFINFLFKKFRIMTGSAVCRLHFVLKKRYKFENIKC